MISSLRATGETSLVLVVTFDDLAYNYLTARKSELGLLVRKSTDLLDKYPELSNVAKQRQYSELFFTSTPFLIKLAMEEVPESALAIYLDADLYFFKNPQSVFDDLGSGSIGIIPHNYPLNRPKLAERYGTFNVGLVVFRNDQQGFQVLNWWASKCIEWCHDFPQDGKYADQGYLNSFPELSTKTVVLENRGLNLAPWNTQSSALELGESGVLVNGQPLVFFHFHALKKVGRSYVSAQWTYLSPLSKPIFQAIYKGYSNQLFELEQNFESNGIHPAAKAKRGVALRGWLFAGYKWALVLVSILTGQAITVDKPR